MPRVLSCGVLMLNPRDEVFACHATGSPRWDLPKGVADPGETPRAAAVREAWEEAGLLLPAAALADLGEFDYLPAKRLHLFGLRVADEAIDLSRCRCRSFFPHHRTGASLPETDRWAWQPLAGAPDWAGKSLARLLGRLDAGLLAALPFAADVSIA